MNINISKRQKIIVSSVLLTLGLVSTQLVNFELRFKFIAGLGFCAFLLSLWSLWEGINKTKAFILMILPVFFTVALASAYFLLEIRWLTRLPVVVFFGLMFYLLLLAQNVFNVASIRTIPLYRAASTASFLFTLLSALFVYNVIYALKLLFIWNGLAVIFVSFPLIIQVLWSVEMEDRVALSLYVQSAILSFLLGELAFVFSFWPIVNPIVWSLALSAALYVILGTTVDYLHKRLTLVILADYLFIGILIIILTGFLSSWGGERAAGVFQIAGFSVLSLILYVLIIRRTIKDKLIPKVF